MRQLYQGYLRSLRSPWWQYRSGQLRQWLSAAAQKALAQPRLASLAHRLVIDQRYRLNLGHPERVSLLLVGCGGTGSVAAHSLAQLATWAATAGLDLRLYFIDPDVVEERNLVRQNFCRAELGAPKALTLAWRFNAAFGLNIIPVVERFSADMLREYAPAHAANGTLTIVVGAVDNVCARRDMAQAIEARLAGRLGYHANRDKLVWLDAGNERVNGQVLIGTGLEPQPLLSPLGYCTDLPLPHIQEPTLLMDRDRPLRQAQDRLTDADLSCAELSALDEQSAMINRLMATWLGIYLFRLLQSRDLDLMATYVSLQSGVTRSTPITGGRVVMPPRVQPQPLPVAQTGLEPVEFETGQACPNCGGELIAGQDEWQGILIDVQFCSRCPWREESCPECGHDILEEELEGETGQVVLGLGCTNCGWQAPYPDQYQPQPAPAGTADGA